MASEPVRAEAGWLALREPADAAARSGDLVEEVRRLVGVGPLEIHDLGCGTGAMARWLAPRLPGPQHWLMYDRDAELLTRVSADPPGPAADGTAVGFESRHGDITRLGRAELAGASLVTASALLDMMTAAELDRFASCCARPGCPVLVALTVTGRVDLSPADPLDAQVASAFNAHQRRGSAAALGPDAVGHAVAAFTRLGRGVTVRRSPWRLGAGQRELAAAWLTGWVGAAVEQEPALAGPAAGYARRRGAQAAAGELDVTVHHEDLLVLP